MTSNKIQPAPDDLRSPRATRYAHHYRKVAR